MLFSCTPHFSRHITPFSFSSNNHTTFETSTTTAYPSSVLMIDTHIFITMHYIITYTLILLFFSLINTSNPVTLHFFFFFVQAITSHVGTLLRAHDLSLQSLTCYLLNSRLLSLYHVPLNKSEPCLKPTISLIYASL